MKKMVDSKAQISIFVIVAVLIVAVVAGFVYLKSSSSESERDRRWFEEHGKEPSVNNIQDFIVDCLEVTSLEALEVIGIQGGYYTAPEKYYDLEWSFIPYFYYQGEYLMPSKEEIQNQLSSFVNANIGKCTDEINFNNFELVYSEPGTSSFIGKSEVVFTTSLSTSIRHGESTTTFELSKHPVSINSSLYNIIEVANYITDSHKEDEDLICINCLVEMAKERNLYIDFIAFEEDSTLVMVLENSTSPDPYLFEFLNKYEESVV